MDALNFLKHQHREVEALFKKATSAKEASERQTYFKQIDHSLRVHSAIEEELFYPEVRRRAEKSEERLEVAEAFEEHALVKTTIEGLESLDPSHQQYEAKLNVLQQLVQHHVDEEEGTMFKIAHHLFTKEELEELGNKLKEAASRAEVPV